MVIAAGMGWMTPDVNLCSCNDDRLCNVGSLMDDVRWCVANDFYAAHCIRGDLCASGFLMMFITAGSNCSLVYRPQH